MTHEERIYTAIQGDSIDRLPFVPRLDLWYQGNKSNGTLPDKYKNASLIDIVDDLDVGYHCTVPNFSSIEKQDDDAHVCLGIYQTKSVFYSVNVDVEYSVSHEGGRTNTTYQTPYGELKATSYLDDEMIRSGISQPHITDPIIKDHTDYKRVAYIFDHISVKPRYDYYYKIKDLIGNRGVVVGFQYEGGSPMHGILKEMSKFEQFWYDYYDYLDEMEECCDSIRRVLQDIVKIMSESTCDIIYVGANYDYATTNPRFFKDHITKDLKWSADYLHSKNKYCLTHTDGENKQLLEEYLNAHIDIADSVCPAPMTALSLADYRKAFNNNICIWGGIAAISVLENSMSDYEFEKYIDSTLEQCGDGRKIILSVADSVPPAAKWSRIEYMNKKIREFGPVV